MAALRTVSRQSTLQRRGSSVIECKESRIGKAPVTIPKGVKITLTGNNLIVKVRFLKLEPLFLLLKF